jgi:peptide chain release factor subunit 1
LVKPDQANASQGFSPDGYISQVAEDALRYFIDPETTLPNIKGLILGGFADLKNELNDKLEQRLSRIVINVVDVQYGGEVGFRQAINLSQHKISELSFVKEQTVISKLFTAIEKNENYVIGVKETMDAFESGLLKSILIYENLLDKKDDNTLLIDWLMENLNGIEMEIVSNESSIGKQFVDGFGGMAGFMRYKIEVGDEVEEDVYEW